MRNHFTDVHRPVNVRRRPDGQVLRQFRAAGLAGEHEGGAAVLQQGKQEHTDSVQRPPGVKFETAFECPKVELERNKTFSKEPRIPPRKKIRLRSPGAQLALWSSFNIPFLLLPLSNRKCPFLLLNSAFVTKQPSLRGVYSTAQTRASFKAKGTLNGLGIE